MSTERAVPAAPDLLSDSLFGANEAQAAGVRMRAVASMAALAFPAALLVAAIAVAARPCSFEQCRRAQDRAVELLAVAAPTLPLVNAVTKHLPAAVTMIVGVGLSFPIWGALGRRLAGRVVIRAQKDRTVPRWATWWKAYAILCAAWLVVAAVVIAVVR